MAFTNTFTQVKEETESYIGTETKRCYYGQDDGFTEAKDRRELTASINQACDAMGGAVINRSCVDRSDIRRLFFYWKTIDAHRECAGGKFGHSTAVIETKVGRELSAEAHSIVARVTKREHPVPLDGPVVTFSEYQAWLAAKNAERRRIQEVEHQARLIRDQELMRERGTRVCKKASGFEFFGFIDDVSENGSKVRILVQGTLNGISPGGWQPGPTWDSPTNWRVCE